MAAEPELVRELVSLIFLAQPTSLFHLSVLELGYQASLD